MHGILHNVSPFIRLFSYLFPITIRKAQGINNSVLELCLYRNQWQLGTNDALYSDGTRYRPMLAAFKEIDDKLSAVKNVLVLGTGLGSAVMILNKKGIRPHITLIDHDDISLQWAVELFDEETQKRIKPVCCDANDFIQNNTTQFDLIIIDIFHGRDVPAFATDLHFLQLCRKSIAPDGCFVFNYIENNTGAWDKIKEKMNVVFPANNITTFGINRIVTAIALQTEYVILFYSSSVRAFFRELISVFHP